MFTTQISLRGVYRNLQRRRWAGVTGGRNEYLKALVLSRDAPCADRAIAEHERFALRAYAGGGAPPRLVFLGLVIMQSDAAEAQTKA